jgi:hypothetical protein
MTLNDFIEKYDKPGAVVILEGKRNVFPDDEEKMERFGKLIAEKTQHITFRSGNALGADFFFTQGVTAVNQQRMQVITPYSGHRKKTNYAYETVSLDNVNLVAEPKVVYQSKSHKQTEPLIDKYLAGERDQYAMKAAYIIRDTVKVTGLKGSLPPATFGFFYIDLTDPESGGTGHTKQVCRMNGVPFVNQKVWFKWLENDGETK